MWTKMGPVWLFKRTKMGPVWLFKPLPPGPQISKCVNVFTYAKLPLFFLVILSPVWWGLHDTLVYLDSTYCAPWPPKNVKKIWLLPYFACCWEDSGEDSDVCGALKHIYKMFMSSVDPCILIYGDRGIHLRLQATEQSSFAIIHHNILLNVHVFIILCLYVTVFKPPCKTSHIFRPLSCHCPYGPHWK